MSAVARVRAAYAAIESVDRPEVWITLRPIADALVDAQAVDAQAVDTGVTADQAALPLAGLVVAVKNNIDVAGIATTAACPGYPHGPAADDAPVVARLRAAGAVIIGATNLDQFATGLVGTRSPYGAVRDARAPEYISGGSSSGSAVAVALGLVDIALGTDTAGSGRVPAAFGGIVGIKPTLGVVATTGVVPAARSYDAVTVFARDLDTADVAMGVIAGGVGARALPPNAPLSAPPRARIAIPAALPGLSPDWRRAFDDACTRLRDHSGGDHSGENTVEFVEIDMEPFLAAARLLYDGGLVAERHEAVGSFIDAHAADPGAAGIDPTVGAIISAAGAVPATRLLADRTRLAELTDEAMAALADCDALLIPTTTDHPTIAEVQADPVAVNSRLGTYTNFCNLMDLCAVAVPSGIDSSGMPFGVSVIARSGADALALDLARAVSLPVASVAQPGAVTLAGQEVPWPARAIVDTTELLVVGAHLRDQPLAWQLTDRGARWLGPAATAAHYRMVALATTPPKPGLALVGTGDGVSIRGELWLLGTAMLGEFLAALPAPMALGKVTLDDGRQVVGFGCAQRDWFDGEDISHHGDWRGYLRRITPRAAAARDDVALRRWRRTAFAVPGRPLDTTTAVDWLQGRDLYLDLRTPADFAPITGTSLATLTVEDLRTLATQEAFAGRLLDDGDEWTWRRDIDLHPAEPLPDRGTLHQDADVLVETGIGRDYHEDWMAAPCADATDTVELSLRDEDGRAGLLLRVGEDFGYARGRLPDHTFPATTLAAVLDGNDLDTARDHLDVEVSLGQVTADGSWRVTRSTLPFRIGDDIAPDVDGDTVAVGDRTRTGEATRHVWTVTDAAFAAVLPGGSTDRMGEP